MAAINAIGRRKCSVARIYMQPGSGQFVINNRQWDEYLAHAVLRMKVERPFEILELNREAYDLKVTVAGGGPNGQAEAIRLAISRALEIQDSEYRPTLKKDRLLTVDSRQVERKKYGKRKARRSTQFSKR